MNFSRLRKYLFCVRLFYLFANVLKTLPVAGDDAANVKWFRISDIPPLAFDHDLILKNALTRLNADLLKG